MRSVDPECPNFLDNTNYKFKELHAALDNLGRQLHSEGVGAEVKHASVISTEEEEALQEQGILFALIDARDPNRKPRLGMGDWMDNADEASGNENCTSTSGDDDFKQSATKKRYNSANSP